MKINEFMELQGKRIESVCEAYASLSSHDYHCGSISLIFEDGTKCMIGPTIDEGIYIEWSDEK